MKKNKKTPPIGEPDSMKEEYLFPSASSGDMTGLIPSGTSIDSELDAYKDLFPFMGGKK